MTQHTPTPGPWKKVRRPSHDRDHRWCIVEDDGIGNMVALCPKYVRDQWPEGDILAAAPETAFKLKKHQEWVAVMLEKLHASANKHGVTLGAYVTDFVISKLDETAKERDELRQKLDGSLATSMKLIAQRDTLLAALKSLVAEYHGREDFDGYKTKSSTALTKAQAAIASVEKQL